MKEQTEMSVRGLGLIVLVAFLQVGGNLLLRAGVLGAGGLSLHPGTFLADLRRLLLNPVFDLGVFLYGAASVIWFGVVSSEDLSSSYPVLVALSFIFVTVGAVVLFQETVSWQKTVGVFILLIGILMVATAR
jgi:multidrug transporter EmrE-like cation transporter